jgi:hypothetical protein
VPVLGWSPAVTPRSSVVPGVTCPTGFDGPPCTEEQLVNDRPGYRPAIVAGTAALLVLLDTPPLLTAAILAAMGAQTSSHTRDRWAEDDPFAY